MGFIYTEVNRNQGKIPIIVYGHTSLEPTIQGILANAQEYFNRQQRDIRNQMLERKLGSKPEYAIAVLWHDRKKGFITDTFIFGDLDNWQSNPEIAARVFRTGPLTRNKGVIGCGDALIMLGIEESARRTTRDLKQYLSNNTRAIVQTQLLESGLWVPEGARK